MVWRLLNTGKNHAAMNMAIDEAILLGQKSVPQPTLRIYDWSLPAFSFGYFQRIADEVDVAACESRGVELVRRMTGGGTVIHGWDVTYTVIAPHGAGAMPKEITEAYRVISKCLINGFQRLGVDARPHPPLHPSYPPNPPRPKRKLSLWDNFLCDAPPTHPVQRENCPCGTTFSVTRLRGGERGLSDATHPCTPPGEGRRGGEGTEKLTEADLPNICLTLPARYDIMLKGKKIAGVSQRRNQIGAMYQGYIALDMPPREALSLASRQPGFDQALMTNSTAINLDRSQPIGRERLEAAIVEGFRETINLQWGAESIFAHEAETARILAETKYATKAWNFRR